MVKNEKYLTTNNMYSLYLALNFILDKYNFNFDILFISNGDCLYESDLMNDFVNCKYNNAIGVDVGKYFEDSMKVVVKNNRIIDISKNILPESSYGVSIDLYKYSNSAVKKLYEIVKGFVEINKDLNQWTEKGISILLKSIEGLPFNISNRKWAEIDSIDDYLYANKVFTKFDIKQKQAFLCDLDGTLFIGNSPINNAIKFVIENQNNFDFYYITNNTSKTPKDYVEKLNKFEIKANIKNIITPLYSLINKIKEKKFKSVYLVANKKVYDFLKSELENINLDFDLGNNEAVILTYDTEINYNKLKKIAALLNKKTQVEYYATHMDIVCPSEDGNVPDIGSFIELINLTSHKKPSIVFGKPNKSLIEHIVNRYGVEKVVVVGDRIYTDGQLAKKAQCDFICVLSGETTLIELSKMTSDFLVLKDLGELS
ncbi:MAG: HAD hydrolase-like protein [Endomicrobium sp.]|uniref:HAD hydrolase-like protein n=1 Tax=Candidatus Endomicrobiellum cubanum TaxID=3242325 RepID=UPI00282DD02A|nr:HAD hydrolase-like protein [Endomicrobium sp.]